MTISIRLDEATESRLRQLAMSKQQRLSEFVRQAIQEKLEREQDGESPYELGAVLFGRFSSGEAGRSAHRKELIKRRIRAKHSHAKHRS